MLKVGFYEKEITPPLGDDIPGYAGPRNSTSIHDPMFSRAVAIRTGDAVHECVIMISVDIIYIPPVIYDGVIAKVEKWTSVPQKNIMIAATHTHTGGPVYEDGEFRVLDDAWTEITTQSTADAAIMAFQRMVDATARYASEDVHGLAFCRDYVMKNGEIRTNPGWHNPDIVKPAGKTDPAFPALFFFDTENRPMGAITSFACHHDCKSGTELSADYSGVLSGYMKDYLGRSFVNILLQGFCGNVNAGNPLSETQPTEPAFIRLGERLFQAEKELYERADTLEINAVYAEKRVLPIKRREISPEVVEEHKWVLENVPNDWYQMDISKNENQMFKRTHAVSIIRLSESPEFHAAYIQVVRLGNDVSIYALPGEMYTEYGLYIKEKSPTKYNLLSGTALKGLDGYVPTFDLYDSNSYAVALGSADYVAKTGQQMADKAIEIAMEIEEQVKR